MKKTVLRVMIALLVLIGIGTGYAFHMSGSAESEETVKFWTNIGWLGFGFLLTTLVVTWIHQYQEIGE